MLSPSYRPLEIGRVLVKPVQQVPAKQPAGYPNCEGDRNTPVHMSFACRLSCNMSMVASKHHVGGAG